MTQSNGEPAFSELLDRLWQSKKHPTGRAYTYAEVSQGILDRTGFKITTSGLQQLRTGVNGNPKWGTVKGLATFFGVDPNYFLGADQPGAGEPAGDEPGGDVDQGSELQAAEERVLAAMRDRGVLRVALRADGLDESSLRMVEAVLDQTRRLQGLPEADLSDLLDDE
ncbi:hypothetical protein [Streptomyces sp. CB02460]|uniref:hypothetical protein n=1 Tax=Streptomyces sp. CB02460 TaxID=1703941 RepID=UPI00093ECBE0|nr:hypothetical protein [Streptomyces sp. CB02460]OKJ72283.1 hypothetical protein AMK30_21210 [Streptomyces sp. CB02460]